MCGEKIIEITKLKSDYPCVVYTDGDERKISFGGNQGWFGDHGIIRSQGCGLIAMADTALYLAKKGAGCSSPLTDTVLSALSADTINYKAYMDYVLAFNERYADLDTRINFDFKLFGHRIFRIHTNSIDGRMGKIMNNYFRDNNIDLKAKWGLINKAVYADGSWFEKGVRARRIKAMLSDDIPAVISVGPLLFGKMDGVNCYVADGGDTGKPTYRYAGQRILNHYFTVTAVIEDEAKKENGDFDAVMYEVSSWGKKYYVAESEIKRFSRYNSSFFTNVLFIREK